MLFIRLSIVTPHPTEPPEIKIPRLPKNIFGADRSIRMIVNAALSVVQAGDTRGQLSCMEASLKPPADRWGHESEGFAVQSVFLDNTRDLWFERATLSLIFLL